MTYGQALLAVGALMSALLIACGSGAYAVAISGCSASVDPVVGTGAPIVGRFAWLATNKDAFSALQSVVTILAVLAGAFWGYLKVIRGRVYTTRLEPTVAGRVVSGTDYQALVLAVSIRNVGLTRAWIDQERSTLEVKYMSGEDYEPVYHSPALTPLGVHNAIRYHQWVEPGECIKEESLFALPMTPMHALTVQFRLLRLGSNRQRQGGGLGRSGVEWNAVTVVLPEAPAVVPACALQSLGM